MAPFAVLALLLTAANPDLPIGRSTPPPAPAPAASPAPVSANPMADSAAQDSLAPSDDYGYVAFCYGAESGYLKLYDQVMPEVERIERAFPGSVPIDQALAEYPQLRSESQAHLTAYAAALSAAEKASTQAIAPRGLQVIRQGRSTWDGAARATPAQTAQAWMGWAAPEDCSERATALADRSRLLGAVLQGGGTGQGSVELDRLANPPALAVVTPARPTPAPATPAAPAPLALRGPANVPAIAAVAPAPAAPQDLGVSFGAPAAQAASTDAGLSVSFGSSLGPASTAAAPAAPPAVPAGLPPLPAPPSAPSTPDPLPWRGIL